MDSHSHPKTRSANPSTIDMLLQLKLPSLPTATTEVKTHPGPIVEKINDKFNPSPRSRFQRVVKHLTQEIYRYKEKLEPGYLRILVIRPSKDPNAMLTGELIKVSYKNLESFPFMALSYHWGYGESDQSIFIPAPSVADVVTVVTSEKHPNEVFLKRIPLKHNLHQALLHLRNPEDQVALWADAICIDQLNEMEKQQEIPKMAELYRKAYVVCIWLGSADLDGRTDRAMDFILVIVQAIDVRDLIIPRNAGLWSDLIYLMRKSWFSRRWVIQEVALSRMAIVQCGHKRVNWRDLSDAIGLLDLHFEEIRPLFKDEQQFKDDEYSFITDLKPLGAKILTDEIANTFRRDNKGNLGEPHQSLESLISRLATFDTSDPRDTILALLNLAKETSPLSRLAKTLAKNKDCPPPQPGNEDAIQMYSYFVFWVAKTTGSIDIICRHWALPLEKPKSVYEQKYAAELPTWIKTVIESTYGKQIEGYHGRKNGDSFVGLPNLRTYNACGSEAAQIRFGLFPSSPPSPLTPSSNEFDEVSPKISPKRKRNSNAATASLQPPKRTRLGSPRSTTSNRTAKRDARDLRDSRDKSIYVKGLNISRVTFTTDPIADGVIPEKGLNKLGWVDQKEVDKVDDTVWRTLIANRGPDGKQPPSIYHRACLRTLVQVSPNGHINTQALLDKKTLPKNMKDYLKRVQAVTWNRVVLEATSPDGETLVGIGPPKTQRGDVIAILFGLSVPCVLRPMENDVNEKYYELVGEAFIYGIMEGEAITRLKREDLEDRTEEFKIV